MNYQTNREFKIQSLHKMLDHQIQGVQRALDPQRQQVKGFSAIQIKLKELQIKLENIQSENYLKDNVFQQHKKLQKIQNAESKFPTQNKDLKTFQKYHQTPSKKKLSNYSQNAQIFQNFELKKNLLSKTEARLPSSGKKSVGCSLKKRKRDSSKKSTKKLSYTINSKSTASFHPSLQTIKKINEGGLKKQILGREIRDYQRENKALKERIRQLKSYEKQYMKMKEVFDKGEKLRKKNRKRLN